jgi:hypothetical protein
VLVKRAQDLHLNSIIGQVSEEEWREGMCQYRSRAFMCPLTEDAQCMVPLLDWFGRNASYNVGYQYNPERASFIAFTVKRIFPGQSMRIRYASEPLVDIFLRHGIVDLSLSPKAEFDGLISDIQLPLPFISPNDPLGVTKRALLELSGVRGIGLGRTVLSATDAVDALGLHVARHLLISWNDPRAANFSRVLSEPLPPLSARAVPLRTLSRSVIVEANLIAHIRAVCAAMLKQIPPPFESKTSSSPTKNNNNNNAANSLSLLKHEAKKLSAEMRRLLESCRAGGD